MLDIPEALILILSTVLVTLWTRAWIASIAIDRNPRSKRKA